MIAEKIYDLLPSEWPLVVGDLPSSNTVSVGIVEYDGENSFEYFGTQETSSIFGPIIKIVVRHTDYETGNQWIEECKKLLHRYHDDTFLSILMIGSPIYLGRSPEKLHEFQITFKTKTKE